MKHDPATCPPCQRGTSVLKLCCIVLASMLFTLLIWAIVK